MTVSTATRSYGATEMWSWKPTFIVMLASLLSYVDRNALAALSPTILRELHMNGQQYGFVVSCFSIAYMIGNPTWGLILDRVGVKKGFGTAVALWSVASASHAGVGGFAGLAIARAGLGAAEGATFPGSLKTVSETLPANRQARGIAVAISGGSLGAVLTPLIVTPLALRFGWRAAFILTGIAGVVWVLGWLALGRTNSVRPAPNQTVTRRLKWFEPQLWAYIASYALGGFPLAFALYAAPLYLSKVLGLTQREIGHLLWIPPAGWELGYLAWGWAADRFLGDVLRPLRWIIALALLGLPLAWLPATRSLSITMALLFWSMFAAAGFVVLSLRYGIQLYSSSRAALITGIGAGSWSAVVAVLMPYIGRLFDQQRYSTACLVSACLPVAGTILWAALSNTTTSHEPATA